MFNAFACASCVCECMRARRLLWVYLFNSRESVMFSYTESKFSLFELLYRLCAQYTRCWCSTRHRSPKTKTILFGKMPSAGKEKQRMRPRRDLIRDEFHVYFDGSSQLCGKCSKYADNLVRCAVGRYPFLA